MATDKDPFDHVVDLPCNAWDGVKVAVIGPSAHDPEMLVVQDKMNRLSMKHRYWVKPLPQPVKVRLIAEDLLRFADKKSRCLNVFHDDEETGTPSITTFITPKQIEAARKAVEHGS